MPRRLRLVPLWLAVLLAAASLCLGADTLNWHKDQNRVDADLHGWPLLKLLEEIAADTGWQVYVEPEAERTASTKFKDLPVPDALRLLLGNLNFALVPQTNGNPRLYVFRTSMQEATKLVPLGPPAKATATGSTNRIPNELIVRLKPGAKIEDLARQLGAKITGRIDSLNAYRLQFQDAAAADAARDLLASNSDVASVDYNYAIGSPPPVQRLLASSMPPLNLKLNPPADKSRVIVGLVDTPIQKLGGNLDAFLLTPLAVGGDAQASAANPTHATAMAETILTSLQIVTGGSTSVQILPVDVYGNSAGTTTFDVAAGVAKAVNAGANPINLSLGSEADSSFLHDVITQARQQGIVFFAAAGNQPVTTPVYPAAYAEVTAVTAGDRNGNIASYANRGSFVAIVAPGTSIVYFNGQPFLVSGTSAATAFASGLAAGIADSARKSLTAAETAVRSSLAVKPNAGP